MMTKLFVFFGFLSVGLMGAILVRPFFKDANPIRITLDKFSRLGWVNKMAVLFIVVQLTMFGGAKHGGTNDVDDVTSTNDVELVEGGDTNQVEIVGGGGDTNLSTCALGLLNRPSILCPPPPFFSTFSAPYRLESVSTNSNISYAMPADGTIRGTWHQTGAYEDVQKVALDGFAFPLGSDLCTSLWAYTWGKVRPQLKNVSNEIAAVGAPMSAIPGVSRFWTAATSNDTYLLTWENFAAGRQSLTTNNQQLTTLSSQLELRRNGDFITRSNDVESVWRRRMPCDLDEDGWIDLIDPDPMAFDEDGFGPHQTLPEGDNTNYYYWVDLVVDQANARVTFEGDGHSALSDPDFIARAGETNRVMLLIGKTYVVHCDLPVQCVDREDDEVCVWSEGRSLGILWPIYLEFVPSEPLLLLAGPLLGAQSNGGGDTGVTVHPERAGGGDYSWPDNFCCYTTAADGSPIFCCDGNCGCGGCYTGDITYRIGEHELSYGGWSCGCSHEPDDPHGGEETPDGPPAGPSVSVSFSHDAIIFEDEYENSPGVFVPRRSTDVEAEFYVYGGTNGGSYAFTLTDGGRLRRLGGSYVPRNGTVNAGEDFHIKVRYDAVSASGREGDIKAKVEFTENGSGRKFSNEAELTAVKVEVTPDVERVGCPNRHRMGVREEFSLQLSPEVRDLTIDCGSDWIDAEGAKYICPIRAASNGIDVRVGSLSYRPSISVVEPTGVLCDSGFNRCTDGVIAMELEPYITPMDVCFSRIRIMEVPTSANGPSGYFTNTVFSSVWYHTSFRGAGEWHRIGRDNFFFADTPTFVEYCPPPLDFGTIDWVIPLAWAEDDASSLDDDMGTIGTVYHQVFTINATGDLQIDKFSQWIRCSADGHVTHSQGIR